MENSNSDIANYQSIGTIGRIL